jgi:CheY-like chemotaxis protein
VNPKAHVYIVEDDVIMVGLLKTLLDMEGYQVSTYVYRHDSSILEILNKMLPDVLLLDVNLRNMDGLEILQQIKNVPELSGIKIIMTSGSDYQDICLRYGADNFLLKPYMPDDLIKMIHSVITPRSSD